MKKKELNIEFKSFNMDERTLVGYASTFGLPADLVGDVIEKGAFADSVRMINRKGIPLLDTHNRNSQYVLGTVISAVEDDHGLLISAKLADTPKVEEVRQKIIQGHIGSMSIGFFILDDEMQVIEGEQYRVIKKAELFEISVVSLPCNPQAEILSIKEAPAIVEEVKPQDELTSEKSPEEKPDEGVKDSAEVIIENASPEQINNLSTMVENLKNTLEKLEENSNE